MGTSQPLTSLLRCFIFCGIDLQWAVSPHTVILTLCLPGLSVKVVGELKNRCCKAPGDLTI